MPLPLSTNPLLSPPTPVPVPAAVAAVEREMDRLPHLPADRRHEEADVRRRFEDARQVQTASEAMKRLPGPNEAIHLAISGRFALWHMVPAVLELSGQVIDELTIATLGFSKKNVEHLCEMVDAGTVKYARLLASHYFKGTSSEIYEFAISNFESRKDRVAFLSVRTHAKLLLMKLADGRTVTVESSANLRSCKNIEQMTLVGSPCLFEFHRRWIVDLFDAAQATKG